MELFKHRPLALGCTLFLVSLFASFYIENNIKIATLISIGVAVSILILIYAVTKRQKLFHILIYITAPSLLLVLAMIISYMSFGKNVLSPYCDGQEYPFNATVTDVQYSNESVGFYIVKIDSVNDSRISAKAEIIVHGKELGIGDVVNAKGTFYPTESSSIGFDEKTYLLSQEIQTEIECSDCTYIETKPMYIKNMLMRSNEFLESRFQLSKSKETSKMLSALVLGNKSELDSSTQRDFRRIGLSHVLALSGMHISIIVSILGLGLKAVRLPRTARYLIIIASTLFFVGVTGFSSSAVRAGLMLIITYLLQLSGLRFSATTTLLLSVTIICIFNPFSIFSVSLILSFFAMLGCIISSELSKRIGRVKRLKSKLISFIFSSLSSSLFALISTLPIVFIMFRSITLLSIPANLFISPLFSLLIYISPVFLFTSGIPYVGSGIDWIFTKLVDIILFLGKWCSSFDNIVLPIIDEIQIGGIIIVALSILALLIVKRKFAVHTLAVSLCGIIILIVGSVIMSNKQENNVSVSGYSYIGGDVVLIEDMGEVTVIDITKTNNSTRSTVLAVAEYYGYYEIDRYILADYSSSSHISVDGLTHNTVVKSVVLPKPVTDKEELVASEIERICQEQSIPVSYLDSVLETENTKICFGAKSFLGDSDLRSIVFYVERDNTRVTYMGASSFELCDYFAENSAFLSDGIIFGSYGPKYNTEYDYNVPYLDKCVFLGNSYSYASNSLKRKVADKKVSSNGYPVRFQLTVDNKDE